MDLLLVLDNFEHLASAASRVADLLGAGPKVKALVTSRARLRLAGEHVYPVPPLEAPPLDGALTPEDLARAGATALFVARARASDPTFVLDGGNAPDVAAVCRALDGLPLAIRQAEQDYQASELFQAVKADTRLAGLTSIDFAVLEGPTRVTHGLATVAA